MKNSAKLSLRRWHVLMLLCILGTGVGIIKIFRHNFEAHIWICSHFPQFAHYGAMDPASKESMDQILRRDKLAFGTFTESFSDPIIVSVWDTGWVLYLRRVWKTRDGYLVLSSGGDPRGYEIFISYQSSLPGTLGKHVDVTTLSEEFLKDYNLPYNFSGARE